MAQQVFRLKERKSNLKKPGHKAATPKLSDRDVEIGQFSARIEFSMTVF